MAFPITWQLAHDTPLRRWCESRLANFDAVQATWPRPLRMHVPRVRPDPLPPWLIGMAFDWRLRLGLELPPPEIVTTAHGGYEVVAARRWSRMAMAAECREPTDDHPVSLLLRGARAHGAGADVVGIRDEDMLARTSVVLARYEACYRTGQVRGDDALLEVGDTIDHDDLLRLCPDAVADQIIRLTALARRALAPLFPATRIETNPDFTTGLVPADGDLVVDDLLIDLKTVSWMRLHPEWLWQVLTYAFLDHGQRGLRSVAIYLSRHGALVRWEVDELLSLLTGTDVTRTALQDEFDAVLGQLT